MFGIKRWLQRREAEKARQLENEKRRVLAQKHEQAAYARDPVPFGKRADVQQVVRARDADTVQQAATTNPMLDPASPLYVGVDRSSYPATSHAHTQHHAPADSHHVTSSHGGHTNHDSGSGYGSSDAGSSSSGDSGGGSGGGD